VRDGRLRTDIGNVLIRWQNTASVRHQALSDFNLNYLGSDPTNEVKWYPERLTDGYMAFQPDLSFKNRLSWWI
jgi:hypothetical protein